MARTVIFPNSGVKHNGTPSEKLCRYRGDLNPVKVAFSETIHAIQLPSPPSDRPRHYLKDPSNVAHLTPAPGRTITQKLPSFWSEGQLLARDSEPIRASRLVHFCEERESARIRREREGLVSDVLALKI
ncbi:hypothetical protein VNO78_24608 [Psophocarpus tetragonolobus]|uniref:Uncharacterized protein n=1 Tax=Psophocarpus tetragonolobus TaxID=3891 RepID=A0AAN9XEN4_PSOTE